MNALDENFATGNGAPIRANGHQFSAGTDFGKVDRRFVLTSRFSLKSFCLAVVFALNPFFFAVMEGLAKDAQRVVFESMSFDEETVSNSAASAQKSNISDESGSEIAALIFGVLLVFCQDSSAKGCHTSN